MPIPRVAIVGRPNVGKSSLMNMIAGAKVSIVDPTPGVTRDRVAAVVDLEPTFKGGAIKPVEFVDTGGFGVYVAEGERFDEVGADLSKLTGSIEEQIAKGIEEADLVLFAIDAQAGITPADREIARLLREGRIGGSKTAKGGKKEKKGEGDGRSKAARDEGPASEERGTNKPTATPPSGRGSRPPVRIVATKVDGPKWEAHAAELANLGFGEPLMVSAKSNYFRRDFLEAIYEILPVPAQEEPAPRADLQVAIIGKRNAGKSTLVNQLAGEPRVIVSEIAGTTRDAIDVRFEMDGRTIIAIDTAGLRRKRSFQNMIEHYAFDRVQRAVDRADVILVLIDATEKISQVDEQLAMLAQKAFKPVIIVVNKWDLVEGRPDRKGKPITTKTFETYVRSELKGLWFAPISFVSGETGRNVRATIDLAFEMREQASSRVTTGKLNRIVRAIMETRAPTDIKGTFAKVFYVAQTGVEPPTITLVVNHPELFKPNYMRFLMNRFREELPFSEVPIRIVVRARRQREDDLASEGGPGRVARGRKGVHERTGARKSAPVEGEALLSDEFSEVVETGGAEEYFDDE